MTFTMSLVGITFEALHADVHVRANEIETRVAVTITQVSAEQVERAEATDSRNRAKVSYRHAISATSISSGEVIYEASAKAVMFLDLGLNTLRPTKEDAFAFLDVAIAYGLPVSASKLRELLFTLGVSDPGPIPLSPTRMQDGDETRDESQDNENIEDEDSNDEP